MSINGITPDQTIAPQNFIKPGQDSSVTQKFESHLLRASKNNMANQLYAQSHDNDPGLLETLAQNLFVIKENGYTLGNTRDLAATIRAYFENAVVKEWTVPDIMYQYVVDESDMNKRVKTVEEKVSDYLGTPLVGISSQLRALIEGLQRQVTNAPNTSWGFDKASNNTETIYTIDDNGEKINRVNLQVNDGNLKVTINNFKEDIRVETVD